MSDEWELKYFVERAAEERDRAEDASSRAEYYEATAVRKGKPARAARLSWRQ